MSRKIKFRTWDTQNKEYSEWTNRDPFFDTSHGQIFFWERVRKEERLKGILLVLAIRAIYRVQRVNDDY